MAYRARFGCNRFNLRVRRDRLSVEIIELAITIVDTATSSGKTIKTVKYRYRPCPRCGRYLEIIIPRLQVCISDAHRPTVSAASRIEFKTTYRIPNSRSISNS